jgi:hypothetical protein
MCEYVWTFWIFGMRVGWLKHFQRWFYHDRGYLMIGRLDFYIGV